jgi:hypothetical protein
MLRGREGEFEEKVREGLPLLKEIVNTTVIMIVGDFDEFGEVVKT